MINKRLFVLAATIVLSMSVASNANQSLQAEVAVEPAAPVNSENTLDPSSGMAPLTMPTPPMISSGPAFNAAQPSAWMSWVDPKTHIPTHMRFMNPASYTQFIQPQFYLEFMKPENMAAWMNPASYQTMMDPQTISYWMNPGSYMHMTNPVMYQETMNPANYMIYLNPNTYLAALTGSQTCDPENPNQAPGWFGGGC